MNYKKLHFAKLLISSTEYYQSDWKRKNLYEAAKEKQTPPQKKQDHIERI